MSKLPKFEQIIAHLRDAASVNLHSVKGFKVLNKHEQGEPYGFEFTVDDTNALAQAMRSGSGMAEDFSHKDHYAPWTTTQSYGFTEVTQPSLKTGEWPYAVHIDFSIVNKSQCGVHLDHDRRVVGRDRDGNAVLTYENDPIVGYVIAEVAKRGIHLNAFKIRPIRVYDEPEPLGFDFESPDVASIEGFVRSMSTHNPGDGSPPPGAGKLSMRKPVPLFPVKPEPAVTGGSTFRHDSSRDLIGWIGNRVTLGEGYREKGLGTRVHIELDAASHLGNVHLDTHGYLTEGGTMDPQRALEHGLYDLAPGWGLAGRTKRFTWQIVAGVSWTPEGSRESGKIGVPMRPVEGPGGSTDPIGGWTFSVGVVFHGRSPKKSRRRH